MNQMEHNISRRELNMRGPGGRGPGGPGGPRGGRMGPPPRRPMGPPPRRPMGPPPRHPMGPPPRRRGCYVATAVYGSYNCPQVWTLRRYRDEVLAQSMAGRAFIRTYYFISPKFLKVFGSCKPLMHGFRHILDKMVQNLNTQGFAGTPYDDPDW